MTRKKAKPRKKNRTRAAARNELPRTTCRERSRIGNLDEVAVARLPPVRLGQDQDAPLNLSAGHIMGIDFDHQAVELY